MKALLPAMILAFVSLASADNKDLIVENQALLNTLISEGLQQRFFKVRILTLQNTIKSFEGLSNHWSQPAQIKITNHSADAFKFEGIKSGTYSESPLCEDYEIHFSGSFVKSRNGSAWDVGPIKTRFLNRVQCL